VGRIDARRVSAAATASVISVWTPPEVPPSRGRGSRWTSGPIEPVSLPETMTRRQIQGILQIETQIPLGCVPTRFRASCRSLVREEAG
jgi:hypothetical protein